MDYVFNEVLLVTVLRYLCSYCRRKRGIFLRSWDKSFLEMRAHWLCIPCHLSVKSTYQILLINSSFLMVSHHIKPPLCPAGAELFMDDSLLRMSFLTLSPNLGARTMYFFYLYKFSVLMFSTKLGWWLKGRWANKSKDGWMDGWVAG